MSSWKSRLGIMGIWIGLFLFCGIAACEDAVPAGFLQMGRAKESSEGIPVYSDASRASVETGRMKAGDSGLILGEKDSFYRILFQDTAGYVAKNRVSVTAVQAPSPLPEAICTTVSLLKPVPSRLDTHLVLQGSITASRPLDTLLFFLWDDRQFQLEMVRMVTLKEPASDISMDAYSRILPLKGLGGGRKTLVVEGISGKDVFVLYRSPAYVRGKSRELPHVTQLCKGLPRQVLDQDVTTAWSPKAKSPSLEFTVAPDAGAVILALEWKEIPDRFTVSSWNQEGTLLSHAVLSDGFYADCLDLEPGVQRIVITPEGERAALSTVRLYAEPYSRHVIQRWSPSPEKLDLLVISTHQDDEFLFFGGAIPYYAARSDVSMSVLYMVNCGRLRYREALDALWSAGLRNHPLFLHLPDNSTYDLREAQSLWNRYNPLGMLIEVIRKYRPEVILVQDFQGEYGNGEHKLTAALTAKAVELAADEKTEPDSAGNHGVWQVKKLYVHLYPENRIHMDWNQPLDGSGVVTPMFLAREAFDRHHSQTVTFNMDSSGKNYDNTLFGLYYSAVGPDILKNDFLENTR